MVLGCASVVGGECVEGVSELVDEPWEEVGRCGVEDLEVDRPVAVHNPVA